MRHTMGYMQHLGGREECMVAMDMNAKKARHVVCAALLYKMVSGAGFEPARVLPH